jgi:hypothetical protein
MPMTNTDDHSSSLENNTICEVYLKVLYFLFDFKGAPMQGEHKTIFSGLKICKMALSDQIDFPAFFHLQKMTITGIS